MTKRARQSSASPASSRWQARSTPASTALVSKLYSATGQTGDVSRRCASCPAVASSSSPDSVWVFWQWQRTWRGLPSTMLASPTRRSLAPALSGSTAFHLRQLSLLSHVADDGKAARRSLQQPPQIMCVCCAPIRTAHSIRASRRTRRRRAETLAVPTFTAASSLPATSCC